MYVRVVLTHVSVSGSAGVYGSGSAVSYLQIHSLYLHAHVAEE